MQKMKTKYTKNVFYTKEKVGTKIAYFYYKKPRALQIKQETELSADQYADHTERGGGAMNTTVIGMGLLYLAQFLFFGIVAIYMIKNHKI